MVGSVKCYVPEGLVAQVVSNVIPLIFIEVFLIKELINFVIDNAQEMVVMFHPLSANKFKNFKVPLTIIIGVEFKHYLRVQLQIVGEHRENIQYILE